MAVEADVADRFVTLGRLRFHYRDWGNESAQALVCLHGFTGHARTWESLRNITSPTLLVRGVESDVLSPALARRMVEAIPNCRLVEVPDSGHSVPGDNPPGFLAAVRTFL